MDSCSDEVTLEHLMARYQAADPEATTVLIDKLSPPLLRFFLMQSSSRRDADDLFQETWLRIHRVRHTYRTGAPVLPWVFAIARHVRVDGFRKRFRIEKNEMATDVLPENSQPIEPAARTQPPEFATLMAALPDNQREVVTLLKVNGLSLEEVARVTSSSVGAPGLRKAPVGAEGAGPVSEEGQTPRHSIWKKRLKEPRKWKLVLGPNWGR